ncbi:DUF2635 domain-containing protein [Pseudomonas sp.]|uniref:DUF2635 domain-containing protein n=1 Tax=Pseudomonas sp. TaxID=306 RepID=UPI003D0C7BB2
MKTMFVKPAEGLKIRHPDRPDVILPAEGAEVACSSYWMRRLKEGSVLKTTAAKTKGGK